MLWLLCAWGFRTYGELFWKALQVELAIEGNYGRVAI
jgi:hypothetical protein